MAGLLPLWCLRHLGRLPPLRRLSPLWRLRRLPPLWRLSPLWLLITVWWMMRDALRFAGVARLLRHVR